MGQEGAHMVGKKTEGQISSQAAEIRSPEKKCFACNEKTHSLDQCRIKHNLVSVTQLFGHATKVPFYNIQPSAEEVEKEKFYHHCLLITSTISNLDPAKVKDELQKYWKLYSGWEVRRECRNNFIASFNSEDDLISCLKHPIMETYLDDKEVKFTVTRWTEGDAESIDLNWQWFSVRGVPRIYRNWKRLYQVASAIGVLIGVDEESLEAGGTEPIRLKIASLNVDDAHFSHHFVFRWSCRMVTFTIEGKEKDTNQQKKELREQNSKVHLDAINKESEKRIDKIIEIPTEKMNEGTTQENSSSTRIVTSTSNHVLDIGDCSHKEHRKELITSRGEAGRIIDGLPTFITGSKYTEESRFGETKENIISVPTNNTMNCEKTEVHSPKTEGLQSISRSSTNMIGKEHFTGIPERPIIHVYTRRAKKQTSESSSKNESTQSTGGCTKGTDTEGFGMDGMALGVQFHEKQYASKVGIRLAQNSKKVETECDTHDSFSKMGLQENLLKGIYQYGLEKPSAAHRRGIVPLCKGLDVIQQSLSGTTVTICCGVLQQLDYGSVECQALVLVPTRDIAQETEKTIQSLGQCLGVKAHACAAGYSIHAEKQILSSTVQVLIGTPGRVLDVLQKRALCPDHIRILILDEADELLTGHYKDQIYNIMQLLPKKIQVGVFSATFSSEVLQISHKFMDKPVTIIVPIDEELKDINMEQFHVKVYMEELKLDKLCDLFDMMVVTQSIIFVTTQHKVKSLIQKIRSKDITVSASHGGMTHQARDTAIEEFRSGSSRILIATDLRHTDVVQAPVVINYDLPTHPVHYIRRVLRNGQPDSKGVVISFVTCDDEHNLSDIQRFCNSQIGELPSKIAHLPIGYRVRKQN